MGIPQILMIVLCTLNVIVSLMRHDELIVQRRNALVDISAQVILIAILYAGGFWSQ